MTAKDSRQKKARPAAKSNVPKAQPKVTSTATSVTTLQQLPMESGGALEEVHARQLDKMPGGSSEQRQNFLSQIQNKHGNQHVQRVLDHTEKRTTATEGTPGVQRNLFSWLDTQRHNAMEGLGMETAQEADRGRATAFYAGGPYGPETVIGAGGNGGFDVTFDPVRGIETITIKGGVRFQDGLSVAGGTVTPFNSDLQALANQAQALPPAQQAAFVAGYQWSAAEKAPWLTKLRANVQGIWENQHEFFINKPEWEWITAHVSIALDLREMAPGEARADDDHLVVDTVKEPAGQSATGAQVAPGSGTDAFDQVMTISSSDVDPRTDNLLAGGDAMTIFFDHDSDALTAAAQAKLNTFIATYQGAPGNVASNPTEITLIGNTSASGSEAYNLDLSERRTTAVKDYLGANGFTNVNTRSTEFGLGEAFADENADAAAQARERSVEMIVDSGDAQNVAAHEFGHAFGLGDEYATNPGSRITGTGANPGTAAAHDAMVQQMTLPDGTNLPGAIHENNEGIMSLGNTVRPQHYATFHHALVEVTGIDEWSLGPAPPTAGTAGGGAGGAAPAPDEGGGGA